MIIKSLYNLEDGTLITLHPKVMVLEVKNISTSSYNLSKQQFAVLYLLCISHLEIVHYAEFNEVLGSIDIHFKSLPKLRQAVSSLKQELASYRVYNLITNIKNTGYTISKNWVEPTSIAPKKDYLMMRNILRGLLGAVN